MAGLHQRYTDDREATIFYALSLDATALPSENEQGRKQQKTGISHETPADISFCGT